MPISPAFMTRFARLAPGGMTAVSKSAFAFIAAACDLAAILAGAVAAGVLTKLDGRGIENVADQLGQFGALIAVIFIASNVLRGDYVYENYLNLGAHARRCGSAWTGAFLIALAIEFMTRTTADLSRVAVGLFLAVCFGLLSAERLILVRWIRRSAERGGAGSRRILIVGFEPDIEAFYKRYERDSFGVRIATASVLRKAGSLDEDLALAAATARILRPEDVFILTPWDDIDVLERCVNAFLRIPAAIHLGSDEVLERFANARVASTGRISSLNLARPLSPGHVAAKRLFDIVASLAALIILSPLMLCLAAAIKTGSPGPAIFRQRRYGFNQQPFRIYKFRSMSTLEDGRKVLQATQNDSRVTKLGRFMRRTNLDELPQLINVLIGDMSLVGPRPHAMAHDQSYEPSVTLYARRHNVKPGITGWAQVNGLRGEITPENLKARIEHDLYYIDNMSMWLDLQILWRTLMSKTSFENAY